MCYLEFVRAVSNRSRNLLKDARRSAMPDFPDTKGRNSINAASTPTYCYLHSNGAEYLHLSIVIAYFSFKILHISNKILLFF